MMRPERRIGLVRAAALGVLAVAAWGCSGAPAGPPLHPASGRVLVDGRPAKGVEVRLAPIGEPTSMDAVRPFAVTGDDGEFALGTHEKGDGAPEGRYKVLLFWPDKPPGPEPAVDRLGGAYSDPLATPLETSVAGGEGRLADFEAATGPAPSRRRPSGRPKARPDHDGLD